MKAVFHVSALFTVAAATLTSSDFTKTTTILFARAL